MIRKHRKLFPTSTDNPSGLSCPDICDSTCPYGCDPYMNFYTITPPPPPRPPPSVPAKQGGHSSDLTVTIVASLVSCIVVIMAIKFCPGYWKLCCRRRRRPREGDQEEFPDENRGPAAVIDHPIWHINTIGLQPSAINSITIFRYKKGDGLVEGTECSICLNEFENDEILRWLPKCSHAFHVPCIDTWLRSHTNCPVCRSGILSNTQTTMIPAGSNALNYNNSRPDEESPMPNLEIRGEFDTNEIRYEEFFENRADTGEINETQQVYDNDDQDVDDNTKINIGSKGNATDCWYIEDLKNKRMIEGGKNVRKAIRRSVSVDSLMGPNANLGLSECEDVSEDQIAEAGEEDSENNVGENPNSTRTRFLHERPVRMKRSLTYSARSLLSRQNSRTADSVVLHPL